MSQKYLFKNYSYSIGTSKKKIEKALIRNNYTKNVNMNVQWTRFSNLLAQNNPTGFDMPLISISFLEQNEKSFEQINFTIRVIAVDSLKWTSISF